jgi:FkbM family methyltransferase
MHSFLRKTAHRVESGLSKNLVQPWRAHRQFEEQYMGKLLARLGVDCVLDVGANIGQYALMLREYSGYRGRIISFEPTPEPCRILQQNSRRDPLWHVRGIALGNTSGQARFRTLAAASVGNSFLPMVKEDAGDSRFVDVEVQVQRLSDLLPELQKEYGFSRPFLKMDTQGFDLEVFAGAQQVIHSVVGLQSELSVVPFYEGAPDWLYALGIYQKAGFVLSTLVQNNTDWFPRLREIDCVMYRPNL